MSLNNQLIIRQNSNGRFEVHENSCVDNDFKPSKHTIIKYEDTLEKAVIFAQKYSNEELVEYGIWISPSCWKKRAKKK